jgi:HK97 family phage major capsid protein
MSKLNELKDRKVKILSEATTILNRGLNTPTSKAEYAALLEQDTEISDTIQMLERIERTLGPNLPIVSAPAPAVVRSERQESADRKAKVEAAYRSFFRFGYQPSRPEQRDVLTSNDGSVIVPQEMASGFVSAQKFFGPIATLVKQMKQDSGAPRKLSISDDTASTMTYLPESSSTAGVEADPTVSSVIPGTDALVTTIKYSLQELEDAESLEVFIRDSAGLRVSRAVEYALSTGKDNGSNTALPNSPIGGLLGNVATGVAQSSLSAGIPYASLVALAGSVDHAYYEGGAFLAGPSVFNYLVAQVDSTGRPLYKFDPATGLLQIAGKPLYVNNAMAAYNAASSPVVLFGDYSRAYAFLNGGGMKVRILAERYIDQLEIGAVIYQRIGAAKLITGAVKALVTASS